MIDIEILKALLSQSPGVAMALIIAYFYRRDFIHTRALDAATLVRLLDVLERNAAVQERLTQAAERLEHVAADFIAYVSHREAG